jgi:hypothetical protein
MTEWMVDIDSEGGLATSSEQLERFAHALNVVRGSTGASTGLDVPSGAISASFSIDATDAAEAADHAFSAFCIALTESGFDSASIVRVTVERVAGGETIAA